MVVERSVQDGTFVKSLLQKVRNFLDICGKRSGIETENGNYKEKFIHLDY